VGRSNTLQETVLVTGGFGFLGRAVARAFKRRGFRVVGIGHGNWSADEAMQHGFDQWHACDVSLATLSALGIAADRIVHCASSSSVGESIEQPLEAFRRTVQTTAELLEHVRLSGARPVVVYPSSAAVYGAADDRPLLETDRPNPVSPYGFHKLMTEQLLASQAACFGLRVAIVRLFSVYGNGLGKQLLWDAAGKLSSAAADVTFAGTGEETRDWLHVDDAATLVAAASDGDEPCLVVNGGSGERVTVSTVLHMLREALGATPAIRFSGKVRPGDPRHYLADTTRATSLGWRPAVSLRDGLARYAEWYAASKAAAGALE
jgi:UDP-glucose 4-epimerase